MIKLVLSFGLAVALLVATASCTSSDPRREIIGELGVEVATLRYVDANPARAEKVRGAVQLVAAVMEWQEFTTVDLLHLAVVDLLDLDQQPPVEQALARAIIELVVADLRLGAPGGVLDEATRERLRRLLAAIERGAVA